jgi:hypothetical protein
MKKSTLYIASIATATILAAYSIFPKTFNNLGKTALDTIDKYFHGTGKESSQVAKAPDYSASTLDSKIKVNVKENKKTGEIVYKISGIPEKKESAISNENIGKITNYILSLEGTENIGISIGSKGYTFQLFPGCSLNKSSKSYSIELTVTNYLPSTEKDPAKGVYSQEVRNKKIEDFVLDLIKSLPEADLKEPVEEGKVIIHWKPVSKGLGISGGGVGQSEHMTKDLETSVSDKSAYELPFFLLPPTQEPLFTEAFLSLISLEKTVAKEQGNGISAEKIGDIAKEEGLNILAMEFYGMAVDKYLKEGSKDDVKRIVRKVLEVYDN